MSVKICPVCGRKFEGRRTYCNAECSKEGYKLRQRELKAERRKADNAQVSKKNALQDTARAARIAGMSYGQYVAQQNQTASFRKEG